MSDKCICLVTIHGIGFEQRPTRGKPLTGYADTLHLRLSRALQGEAARLSDDPTSQRAKAGRGLAGPVYVESDWPPRSERREEGLARLGAWRDPSHPREVGAVDGAKAPLTEPGARLAHVALVYSRMEDQGPHVGAAVDSLGATLANIGHYSSVLAATHMIFSDLVALGAHQQQHATPALETSGDGELPSSLRVRGDADHRWRRDHPGPESPTAAPPEPISNPMVVVGQITDDVATYIYHNELRNRVRDFVREALLRLLYREDVAGIIVNGHSQGTTIAYDVLSQLEPYEASRVFAFITAGSPLRKYVDLFHWGNDIGAIRSIDPQARAPIPAGAARETALAKKNDPMRPRWLNFWDPRDPVADRLTPVKRDSADDDAPLDPTAPTLFQWLNARTGARANVQVDDRQVDNVANTVGSGVRAHNYWDNETEFIAPLTNLLRGIVADHFH
jgi:hypothetical protein